MNVTTASSCIQEIQYYKTSPVDLLQIQKQRISEKSVGGQRQQTHIQSKKEQFSQKKNEYW